MEAYMAHIIQSAEVFKHCTRNEATNLLAPYVKLRAITARQPVYRIGDRADAVYIIVKGRVKVSVINSFGKELVIEIALPHCSIGWENALKETDFTLCATALEDTTVLKIPTEDIRFLMNTNVHFANALCQYTSEKLVGAWHQHISFLYQPVRQRVAKSIMSLYRIYRCNVSNALMPANRTELASIAGVTRETATRLVKEFERERMLEVFDENVRITDSEALDKLAHQYD